MDFTPARIDDELYRHLKSLARRIHAERARGSQTLQPTALVNEAWMRLEKAGGVQVDRAHFIATAAVAMRHVIHDRARALRREKRGPGLHRTTLSGIPGAAEDGASLLDIDSALTELAKANPRDADVVTLRAIGGLTVAEIAELLDIGVRTVERSWRRGRAFMRSRLDST